jgi:hypothetical protein
LQLASLDDVLQKAAVKAGIILLELPKGPNRHRVQDHSVSAQWIIFMRPSRVAKAGAHQPNAVVMPKTPPKAVNTSKVVPLTQEKHRVIARDEKCQGVIIGIGSRRSPFSYTASTCFVMASSFYAAFPRDWLLRPKPAALSNPAAIRCSLRCKTDSERLVHGAHGARIQFSKTTQNPALIDATDQIVVLNHNTGPDLGRLTASGRIKIDFNDVAAKVFVRA